MEQRLTVQLEQLSQAVGHKSRMAMLAALMGGIALPAGELAYRAGVTFQTASSHLRILEKAGFIKVIKCGRHRYYELSSHEVAEGLESLASSLEPLLPARPSAVPPHLYQARYCYDHLAGQLGVKITATLVKEGAISLNNTAFDCHQGHESLWAMFGIDLVVLGKSSRKFATRCVDWSERKPHLAGAVGAALARGLEEQQLIVRSRDDRSVTITPAGHDFFDQFLGHGWQD